jgi:hypothetical protein
MRIAIGGVVLVAAVGGGGYGLVRYQDAQQKQAIAAAWSSFARCLTGGDLEKDERPSQRFRNLQLVAMTMTDAERTQEGSDKPWPISCASLGHAVNETMRNAGLAENGKKDLAAASEALAKALNEGNSFTVDLTDQVDAVFDQAKEAKIEAVASAAAPKAPLPQRPLSATFLATVEPLSRASFVLKNAFTDAHPAGALRLLVEEKGVDKAPFLCTFDAKAPTVRCKTLPKSLAEGHGLRLLGTADDDSAPLVFAGDRGTAGVFRADTGEKIDAMYSYGGYAKADGSSAVLGYNGESHDLLITRRTSSGTVPRTKIEVDFDLGNFYYSSQLLWNEMLLRGITKQKERKLFAGTLDFHGEPFKDLGAVGVLPEPGLVTDAPDEPPHIAGCRTDKAMVVRVKGYDNDFMSFLIGGKWTPPISPDVTGGILSCHGTEAVVTRLEPAGEGSAWKTSVTQCQCTSAGCTGGVVSMEKVPEGPLRVRPARGPRGRGGPGRQAPGRVGRGRARRRADAPREGRSDRPGGGPDPVRRHGEGRPGGKALHAVRSAPVLAGRLRGAAAQHRGGHPRAADRSGRQGGAGDGEVGVRGLGSPGASPGARTRSPPPVPR